MPSASQFCSSPRLRSTDLPAPKPSSRRNGTSSPPSRLLCRAKRHIDAHLADISGPEEVAAALGVSPQRLQACFRRIEEVSLQAYLRKSRTAYAKLYLSTTELSSEQVARRVGFDSVEAADRAFQKASGYTMTEFRGLFRPRP